MKYIKKYDSHEQHEADIEDIKKLEMHLSHCVQEGLTFYHPYSLKKMGVGDYLLKDGSVIKNLDDIEDYTSVIAVKVIPEYFLPDGKARFAAIRAGNRKTVSGSVVTYPSADIDQTIDWGSNKYNVAALEHFTSVPCADTDTVNIDKHKILNNYTAQGWHSSGCTCMEISTKYETLNPLIWQKYKNNNVTDSTSSTNTNNVYGTTTYNNLNDWYMYTSNLDEYNKAENTHSGTAPIPSPYIGTNGIYVFNGAYRTTTDTSTNMFTDIDGKANTAVLLADITENNRTHNAALFCSEYTVKDSDTDEFSDWYAPGQWYLPAIGELVFILSGWATIQEAIYEYNQKSGLGTTFRTSNLYWSSTQYSNGKALYINTQYGLVGYNSKNNTYYVRPFLRLD
ncbi:MAG: hypothetical protein [Hatfieldvirus porci]|uniref:DUF1566 domain-containing protein n=1 Tax=phage Lak_Megaphage_RVC_JS4_GC31 TaxID=3109228 RepID=A0ABZ0Z4E6_9CAUD|nr:MAG: hypothetical protein [phage Lak_Megaphage_RVC_JS4_GC31]